MGLYQDCSFYGPKMVEFVAKTHCPGTKQWPPRSIHPAAAAPAASMCQVPDMALDEAVGRKKKRKVETLGRPVEVAMFQWHSLRACDTTPADD
ncbi:hypothetical protein CEP54_011299 [Fusarium duplospermum]|uniref:Uncharacterized protein n=1 Tax=Fusarium duplospermum TaxID=1325734 RepID=A0A428PFC5_9HYPO|nr:hypothetical protein CEP54_011299 [Fusarium duplospermum]